MNKLFFLICISVLAACSNGGNGQKIEGHFPAFKNTAVSVLKFENQQSIVVDSSVVDSDGDFELYVPVHSPDFFQIKFSNGQQVGLALAPGDEPELSLKEGAAFPDKIEVKGSENTAKMISFFDQCSEFELKRNGLIEQVQALGNPPSDPQKSQALVNEINALGKAYYDYVKGFAQENIASPVVFSALSKLNLQTEFELYKQAIEALKGTMAHNGYYQALSTQVNLAEKQLEAQKQKALIQEKLKPGNIAPEINLNDPNGNPVALSSLRGKYVLIDFWASWCRPCRMENPNVVKMYKKYKKKGFEIYSVSLDRTKDAWVQAIEADGLNWTHVSDLKFWSSAAAKDYGVSGIPFTVLLNPEGEIIASNIRGEGLRNKMVEIFGF